MKDKIEFPQFYSPCPTKEAIFRNYMEKNEAEVNIVPQNQVHWIPPPAKTSSKLEITKKHIIIN